ncbi:hypothetical protein ABEG17_08405 [Pedococcus sp. KACC 23699]|uniref:Uncharacterized protein n=1 Tax=Pedococcus sp. KACC 23699 TaxID=3149228 RepID=A0AAU7JY06_9MICO
MTSLGSPVHISLGSGELTGTATIVLPAPTPQDWPAGLAFDPFPATYDEQDGSWVAQDGTYDPSAGTITLSVTHFSWWNPFSWNYHAIEDSLRQAGADMAGIPSGIAPTCANSPGADQAQLTGTGSKLVDACLDTDGSDVVLRMRGVKDYPLLVSWSGQATLQKHTDYGVDLSSLYRWFAATTHAIGQEQVLLPSGGDVHLLVAPDANAPVLVNVAYDPHLQLAGIVDATLRVVQAVRGATGVETTLEEVGSTVEDTACALAQLPKLTKDPVGTSATMIADCAAQVLRDASKGATSRLLRVVGAIPKVLASLVGVIVYAANTVASEVFTARDLLAGTTSQDFNIAAAGSPGATSPGGTGAQSPWPTQGNDGPPALWAWFGANFTFPDWVSCDTAVTWCIAGEGDQVHIIKVHGLVDTASVPLAARDPAVALTKAGLSKTVVAQVLRAH